MQLRDASRTPTVFGIDAKAFAIIFPSLFFIKLTVIFLDLVVLGFFFYLKVKGLEVGFFYRKLRSRLRSGTVVSRPWWLTKKWRV